MKKVKITKNLIKKIENEAKKYFQKASGCHDWTHVERVRTLALKIGKKEKADLGILELAALLHDICRHEEMKSKGKVCHAIRGAEEARVVLQKFKVSEEIIKRVVHCIISHRQRNNHQPDSIEAKVLFDADKLDTIGVMGISRNFIFAGYIGAFIEGKPLYSGLERIHAKKNKDHVWTKDDSAILEYETHMKFVKDKLFTKEGKRIGKERHDYMKKFFERFWEEVRAEK